MRIGVRMGPVWVSTSTRSRRRGSRPSQPSWHATGHAMTPDLREVDFRCQHNHRTQAAAIECAGTIRKQIERGQNLHLITHVRSTPASREADRQRALQEEARREAKATQRAEAAQHREAQRAQVAQQREARQEERRQASAAHRAEAAEHRESAAHQRAEHRAAAAHQRAEQWAQVHEQNDQRWARVHEQNDQRWARVHEQRVQRRRQWSRGWPFTGLIIASVTVLLGAILVGVAGNNSHSALAGTAGALVFFGVLALLVCGAAALWRRFRGGKHDQPIPAVQIHPAAQFAPRPFTDPAGYHPADPYPGRAAAEYWPHTAPPARPGGAPPWET